jgi:hypothetical protein
MQYLLNIQRQLAGNWLIECLPNKTVSGDGSDRWSEG